MASSPAFSFVLRAMGLVCFAAAAMHMLLGLQADLLLGVNLSTQTLTSAGLDSQNRFYGACFMLYGVVLLLAASDLARYVVVLKYTLLVFFVAGMARFLSVWMHGWPPPLVAALFAAELVVPPLLLIWLAKLHTTTAV